MLSAFGYLASHKINIETFITSSSYTEGVERNHIELAPGTYRRVSVALKYLSCV